MTHDIDDLCQSQSEGDVERTGRIDGGSHSRVVVTHQVAHQLVFVLISNDYNSKAEQRSSYKMRNYVIDHHRQNSNPTYCLWTTFLIGRSALD